MALSDKTDTPKPGQVPGIAYSFDLIKKEEFVRAQTFLVLQSINQTDRFGQTALMVAAQVPIWSIPMLEWLYRHGHGFLIDIQDEQGFTALHHAAQTGTVEAVKCLLEKSAAVDLKDNQGNTPLWRAVMSFNHSREKTMLLLAAGANADSENNYRRSPREQLKKTGVEQLLAQYDQQLKQENSVLARLNRQASTELLQRPLTFTAEDEYRSIRLQGFDPAAEPEIRIFDDGVIYV
ncbi:ankyrin repeat domain-containing protein [Cytophagaceae bacterium YF14B1]|uniref:Ankyrin repeat domain-containing protein n=1 Tax=Xanthocytophaga flava TaxID=3048013 RepID=A0AAE3UAW9_9BACT|nr:ankyrin repeat domain-containing protein [Xanthocytophaga flavus]MDJ1485941.1 ankyrin repeat domain-containing protein [Xanthocytophaga flavus]